MAALTHATDQRPVVRVVEDAQGQQYVVEVRRRALTIRPIRAQRGGFSEFTRSFGQIYYDAAAGGPLAGPRRKGR